MSEHRSGPVRNEAARQAILEAAASLFEEHGYDRLTMEGIAARAHTGKQTIYRWWRSKGDLVADCLLEGLILPDQLIPPSTGDVRADLAVWLERIFGLLQDSRGEGLLRSLVAAAAGNADVGRRLRNSLWANSSLIERLRAAAETGELPADLPLPEVSEALLGAVILRALGREAADPEAVDRLLTVVLGVR